jgi:hypothetical protein
MMFSGVGCCNCGPPAVLKMTITGCGYGFVGDDVHLYDGATLFATKTITSAGMLLTWTGVTAGTHYTLVVDTSARFGSCDIPISKTLKWEDSSGPHTLTWTNPYAAGGTGGKGWVSGDGLYALFTNNSGNLLFRSPTLDPPPHESDTQLAPPFSYCPPEDTTETAIYDHISYFNFQIGEDTLTITEVI